MFIDEIKVFAKAGHGGAGCVAFHREAFRPKGGPSGGNGGQGGSVILEATRDLNNLIAQYYQPHLIAENGRPGMGKKMNGRSGKDLIVKVPCGTLVWELEAGEVENQLENEETSDQSDSPSEESPASEAIGRAGELVKEGGLQALRIDVANERDAISVSPKKKRLVADLTEHGQRFEICQGGRGGLGNMNFATARRRTPRFAQPGEPGGEGRFLLELQFMAEVGLVGYPNAGKSTLLRAISKAHPKTAPYPFTTLHPQIGVVEYEDFHRLTVCDVPGLVEGAHHNAGLGHTFLRHVNRCEILVLLIDMAGTDGRLPWDDHKNLLRELELYNAELIEKPRLVVGNKMDEPAAIENLEEFKRRAPGVPVLPIAAAFGEGIPEFKRKIRATVETNRSI